MRGRLMFACIFILSLCGCRKELCYTHDEHSLGVRINLLADWELEWERDYGCGWKDCWNSEWTCRYDDLRPEVPEGIRLIAYHESGISKDFHLKPSGRTVVLGDEGKYSFLLHNDDTEYIVYDNLNSSKDACASTRTSSRAEFRSPNEGERVMNQPDMLFGRYIGNFDVERKTETETVQVEMRPLVYTYWLRLEFSSGYQYVSSARGLFAGMAEKVYLYDGHTGAESASIMFDCEKGENEMSARVMTFGVPNYPGDHYVKQREDGCFMIRLQLNMINGLYKLFDIDISDQMIRQPRGGVIKLDGLKISKEDLASGSGGFDVGVDEWDDPIEIPLN